MSIGQSRSSMPESSTLKWLQRIVVAVGVLVLLGLVFGCAIEVSAQTTTPAPVVVAQVPSACAVDTTGMTSNNKKLTDVLCAREIAVIEADRKAAEVKGKQAEQTLKREPNLSVVSIETEIDENGNETVKKYQATPSGSKHALKVRKHERIESVEESRAKAFAALLSACLPGQGYSQTMGRCFTP